MTDPLSQYLSAVDDLVYDNTNLPRAICDIVHKITKPPPCYICVKQKEMLSYGNHDSDKYVKQEDETSFDDLYWDLIGACWTCSRCMRNMCTQHWKQMYNGSYDAVCNECHASIYRY